MAIKVMGKPLLQEKIQQIFDVGNNVMVLTTAGEIYTLGQKAEVKTIAATPVQEARKRGPKTGSKRAKQANVAEATPVSREQMNGETTNVTLGESIIATSSALS